jgi:probable phosphoglycerate mutase
VEFVLIRHGEPDRQAAERHDPGLSDLGALQAQRLGQYLRAENISALYTSPLTRAAQTADILGSALGLQPRVRDGLAEFDRDAPEYLNFEDLAADTDPRYLAFLRGDLSPWGTDLESFRARVTAEIERIIGAHRGERVAVVCHGGVINCYLSALVGADRMGIHNPAATGFARVKANSVGRRELGSMNETPHLRGIDVLADA